MLCSSGLIGYGVYVGFFFFFFFGGGGGGCVCVWGGGIYFLFVSLCKLVCLLFNVLPSRLFTDI